MRTFLHRLRDLWAMALCVPAALTLFSCAGRDMVVERPEGAGLLISTTANELWEEIRKNSSRVLLLDFWATWCEPCKKESPEILSWKKQYRNEGLGVLLVSVNFFSEGKRIRDFLRAHNVDFPTFLKAEKDHSFISTIHPDWSGAIPALFLLDENRRIVFFWEGEIPLSTVEKRIQELLRPANRPIP